MSATGTDNWVLTGQRALVTGANSGIGVCVARELGAAGARIVVNCIEDEDRAQKVIDELRSFGSEALAIRADVSKEEEVRSMFATMFDAYAIASIFWSTTWDCSGTARWSS